MWWDNPLKCLPEPHLHPPAITGAVLTFHLYRENPGQPQASGEQGTKNLILSFFSSKTLLKLLAETIG